MQWNKVLVIYNRTPGEANLLAFLGNVFSKRSEVSITVATVVEKLPNLPRTAGKVTGRRKALVRLREADEEQSGVIRDKLMAMGFSPQQITVGLVEQHKSLTAQFADEVREGGYGTVVLGAPQKEGARGMVFSGVSGEMLQSLTGAAVCMVK